jgi:hypothetical protein
VHVQQGQHGAGLRADDDATAAWWSAPAAGLTVSGRRGTQPGPSGSGEVVNWHLICGPPPSPGRSNPPI